MRLHLSVLFVFALVASVFAAWSPINSGDSGACGRKNGNVLNAIGKFCQNRGIMAPSPYARNGMFSDRGNVWIGIEGTCQPAQWVPWEWCFRQFYNICKNGNAAGSSSRYYGNGNCQKWSIVTW